MGWIYGLLSVWVKRKNGWGNNYESQEFVRVLKKFVNVVFGSFGRELKKNDQCPCGQNFDVLGRGLKQGACGVGVFKRL